MLFDISRAEAVRKLVTTRAEPLSAVLVTDGSDLTEWSGSPSPELFGGTRARYRRGTDLVFVDAPEGTGGTLTATYSDVAGDAVEDGLIQLRTRFLVPPTTDGVDVEIELRAPGGTPYLWSVDDPDEGFQTVELRAEEGRPDGSQAAPGELQFRFSLNGATVTDRGFWVDFVETVPFRERPRSDTLNTENVASTNDQIIRRVDERISSVLTTLATEAQYDWWVESDELYFQPGGTEDPGLSIVEGETPVVSYDLNPRFDDITNAVVVQGDGVKATASSGNSIDFFGVEPRTETVVDRSIQREAEAEARARGILRDKSVDDLSMDWTIADPGFAALSPENSLRVEWPSEDLDSSFAVTSVKTNEDGTVTVGLTGSSLSRR